MILSRHAYLDSATLGLLKIAGHEYPLRTVEPKWVPGPTRGGLPSVSCVPEGHYRLARRQRANGTPCLLLRNPDLGIYGEPAEVPAAGGRCLVELHAANYARELKGCIAPGLTVKVGLGHDLGDCAMLTSSATALKFALEAFEQGDTELDIVNSLGTTELPT